MITKDLIPQHVYTFQDGRTRKILEFNPGERRRWLVYRDGGQRRCTMNAVKFARLVVADVTPHNLGLAGARV